MVTEKFDDVMSDTPPQNLQSNGVYKFCFLKHLSLNVFGLSLPQEIKTFQ